MTDLDTIKSILDKRNITYKSGALYKSGPLNPEDPYDLRTKNVKMGHIITIDGGYIGFFSQLNFNNDGDLESVEAYE